jgi:ketosteroid isomerase-like protein
MIDHITLITTFYTAFQQRDFKRMNACYDDSIIFNDAVFGLLEGEEVKSMWEMLCKQASDFSLSFGDIQMLDEEYATCTWTATYTFSKTGRKVVNKVKAHMRLVDGKIVEHTDQFDIWAWSRQALGVSGLLLGWTAFMQRKIQQGARATLERYMANA